MAGQTGKGTKEVAARQATGKKPSGKAALEGSGTAKAVSGTEKRIPGMPDQVFISEADQYLFSQGTHYDIYKKRSEERRVGKECL